ncbi:MAG: hypothetical protein CVT98_00840 [Bacteroidetes bacterium HGW-Bacteroidetes-15]|jgi:hypothetical protein|nr:MAG: hypothetical protein CVT98_00840 [Bacteroidetes bacterium HGW-Bacteroidetes-15]
MNKIISIVVILSTLTLVVNAQSESDSLDNKNLSIMYFHAGFQMQEYNNLNTVLQNNGFTTLSDNSFLMGGGYQYLSKLNIINLSDFSVFVQSSSEQNNTTKIKGFEISQNFGYMFINENKFQLISFGGLAYTWLSAKMFTEIPNNTTVSNFLSGTANQFEMSANYWLANFGGQFTFSPTMDKKTGEKLIIGIKSSYAIPISETNWEMDNINLKDGPEIDKGRFAVSLILGITL